MKIFEDRNELNIKTQMRAQSFAICQRAGARMSDVSIYPESFGIFIFVDVKHSARELCAIKLSPIRVPDETTKIYRYSAWRPVSYK